MTDELPTWAADHLERVEDPGERAALSELYRRRRADDRIMLECRMRAPWVRGLTKEECGRLRLCWVCGSDLPERRQYWCSDACVARWGRQHEWSAASAAALVRDRHRCTRCGAKGRTLGPCAIDGEPWPCSAVRIAAYARPRQEPPEDHYTSGGVVVALEVNHRVPRNGAGYETGCHHHLKLLETLCHECHVAETNAQAARRRRGAVA